MTVLRGTPIGGSLSRPPFWRKEVSDREVHLHVSGRIVQSVAQIFFGPQIRPGPSASREARDRGCRRAQSVNR